MSIKQQLLTNLITSCRELNITSQPLSNVTDKCGVWWHFTDDDFRFGITTIFKVIPFDSNYDGSFIEDILDIIRTGCSLK